MIETEKTPRSSSEAAFTEGPEKIDLIEYIIREIKVLKRLWWIPVLAALICTAISFIRADRTYTPAYQTSAVVYVEMADSEGDSWQNCLTAEQMETFVPYLLSNGVLSDAIEKELGYTGMPGSFSISADSNTNLLNLTVTGSDPEKIHDLLQAVIQVLPDTLGYIVGPTHFQVFKDTGVPREPYNQKLSNLDILKQSIRSSVKVFLFLMALILLYGLTVRTIVTREDIRQNLNTNLLGEIPSIRLKKRSRKDLNQLTIENKGISYRLPESVRMVRTRFERLAEEKNCRTILVTSSIPGEGKTTVAVNLALSLAEKGKKVLLIDGDMQNPSVCKALQVNPSYRGLSDVLTGHARVNEVIRFVDTSGLYMIPSGKVTKESTELLGSEKMTGLLNHVKDYADYVIIDTPPAMVLGDSLALSKAVDGCIYVVRSDYARRSVILDGFSQMADYGCRIIGTVLNASASDGSGYGYGYGYGYGSSKYKVSQYSGYYGSPYSSKKK